ncbi:MAG: acetylxylan esterase [Candidatus Omnitrophica bacterium]|nr:acetylxylan esterase [Candidatus Omnitrophota bacterium]
MSEKNLSSEYPAKEEVDAWLDSIWRTVEVTPCPAEILTDQGFTHNLGIRHTPGYQYVRFTPDSMSEFFGYWQPARSTPAPLLVHVPGYGAEMSAHPDLVAAGFNVLHISPLGYSTPNGADESKMRNGNWPVLPDTLLSGGSEGYFLWLANCAMAVRWALEQVETLPDRVSFFGTSQGGGGALLLASLFHGRGVRCVAADVPFLTDFPESPNHEAYAMFWDTLRDSDDPESIWRAAGLIDTLSHVHRLDLPVLLTAGGADDICPPNTIQALFDRLPGTRSYTYLEGVEHRYTTQFVPLASAWFRLFA